MTKRDAFDPALVTIKGERGVGKVPVLGADGCLWWARIEAGCGGSISLVVDSHSGRLKRENARTGEVEVVT